MNESENLRQSEVAKGLWPVVALEQIAEAIFDGPFGSNLKSDDYVDKGVRVVRLENIGHLRFIAEKQTYITEHKYEGLKRHVLHANDVLFSSFVDENIRVCLFPSEQGLAINKADCFCIRVDRNICDPRWLTYRLADRSTYEDLKGRVHGATRPRINMAVLKSLRMELPPLAQQRRIVAKIDTLCSGSKRAREQLDRLPQLVENYKQAVLAAAFRGDLSRGWRQAQNVHRPWSETTVGTLLIDIVAGKNLRCEERPPKDDERGTLKVSAVTWGIFDPSQTKTLPKNFVPPEHTRVQAGDLLISRANTVELVGAVVIVHETPSNLFLSDKILRLELEDTDKPWLLWYLRSPTGRRQIEEGSSGNQLSMRNLSQNHLRAISVPWPDPLERLEVVKIIEHAFAWIDHLAADAGSARRLVDRLDEAILAKAFRGELVPQDPNDEPITLLLERLKMERAAVGATAKRRKRRATASN